MGNKQAGFLAGFQTRSTFSGRLNTGLKQVMGLCELSDLGMSTLDEMTSLKSDD